VKDEGSRLVLTGVLTGIVIVMFSFWMAATHPSHAEWPCCSANPDGHAGERIALEDRISALEHRVQVLEANKPK
jgi:hypothetical protein